MTASTNTDTLRQVLQAPLPLQLSPLMGTAFLDGGEAGRFAIYTEPPQAPGREEVLAGLRAQLAAQDGAPASLEALDSDDWEPGQAFEMDMDSDEICGQVLFYRLILARDLDPVGFCAFEINADETGVIFVTLVAAWVRAPSAVPGVQRGFVRQMAGAVYAVLAELDARLQAAGEHGAAFEVLLGLDQESEDGSALLLALRDTLRGWTGPDAAGEAGREPLGIVAVNVSVIGAGAAG
ncbi:MULTISPECIES: hypothetical protein [Cupriavidus]